jgi:hypothetical protein
MPLGEVIPGVDWVLEYLPSTYGDFSILFVFNFE